MVEFTTLGVSKKGGSSFVPRIKPKVPSRKDARDNDNDVGGIENYQLIEKHANDKEPKESDQLHPVEDENTESAIREVINPISSGTLVGNQVQTSSRQEEPSHLAIPTPTFRPCLDSIPGVKTTKHIQVRPQDSPILEVSTPRTNSSDHNSSKLQGRRVDPSLDASNIQSTPLEVLIRHRFKQGILSKSEKQRIEASTGAKLTPREAQIDQASDLSSNCSKKSNDFSTSERRAAVPRLVMVDGKIKVDHLSLLVKRKEADVDLEEIDEGAQRLITSSSFLTSRNIRKVKWTKELTEKFYEGLSYFGTDFGLISILLQGIDRRQIKSKFNIEERTNSWKLTAALKNRKPIGDVAEVLKRNLKIKNARLSPDSPVE